MDGVPIYQIKKGSYYTVHANAVNIQSVSKPRLFFFLTANTYRYRQTCKQSQSYCTERRTALRIHSLNVVCDCASSNCGCTERADCGLQLYATHNLLFVTENQSHPYIRT